MKALCVCPTCGYWIIGEDRDPDQAAHNARVGVLIHQEMAHGVPMTPDRVLTQTRAGLPLN